MYYVQSTMPATAPATRGGGTGGRQRSAVTVALRLLLAGAAAFGLLLPGARSTTGVSRPGWQMSQQNRSGDPADSSESRMTPAELRLDKLCAAGTCKFACRQLELGRRTLQSKTPGAPWLADGIELPPGRAQQPGFILIGAQKAGTTGLMSLVQRSNLIGWAKKPDGKPLKELHFFDHCLGVGMLNTGMFRAPRFDSGFGGARARRQPWCNASQYRKLFELCRAGQVCGDASPSYLVYPGMPALVADALPHGTKLVVMLREPIARALSGYYHQVSEMKKRAQKRNLRTSLVIPTFEQQVQAELDIIERCAGAMPGDLELRYRRCIWPAFAAEMLERTLQPVGPWNASKEYGSGECTPGQVAQLRGFGVESGRGAGSSARERRGPHRRNPRRAPESWADRVAECPSIASVLRSSLRPRPRAVNINRRELS